MLPRRKPRERTKPVERREFPRHRKFIRSHECVVFASVHGCEWEDACAGQNECAHYRTADNSGTGIKPHDWFCFPACNKHHAEQHRIGQRAFEAKYKLSLADICAELARRSPDHKMKAAMRMAV